MAVVLMIAGTALLFNGLCLLVFANFNLGVMLTVLLGVFLLLWGIFYGKIKQITHKGAAGHFKRIVVFLLIAELLLLCFVGLYAQNDNVDYREDAVIVLGAGVRGDKVTIPLKERLDKAIEYSSKNPDAVIVVSGGQGYQETVTEASAMEKYLVSRGVERDKIIKEETATSTNENMRYSKRILDKYFKKDYRTVVITNNFHIYRAVSVAKLEGLEDVTHMHAGLMWYNIVPCYLRETLAILKMWVFG